MLRFRLGRRILSVILCITVLASFLSGCGKKVQKLPEDVTKTIVDEIVNSITSTPGISPTLGPDNQKANTEKIEKTGSIVKLSYEWEDYVCNLETFVYGLIVNELGYGYDVFPAYTLLSDDTEVYGIAYTDYSECYVSDDESESIFLAGFIPYYGEESIPQEEFDEGLILYDMDYTDPNVTFVFAYQSDAYTNHCVVYGQYLQYGIDENGGVKYTAEKYERGKCNEELGSLYSYDESRFVFENNVGQYIPITGTSLYSQIDYASLEDEINNILKNQDKNFVTIELETVASYAKEALDAYFLSYQEETFLGYNVAELIELSKNLDPMECYRLTSDGLMTLNIEPGQDGKETLVKWAIGSACIVVFAVSIVSSMVFIECPVLSSLAGALAGTSIEVFMQVVISSEKPGDIDWRKVGLAAASGALSGFLGPYIYATTSGAGYFFVDSALDGLIGGIERAVGVWLEGGDAASIIKAGGMGFALGFGISGAFKGVGALISKMAQKAASTVTKLSNTLFPKLTKKVSTVTTNIGKKLGEKLGKAGKVIYGIKRVTDSTPFHSKFISNKITFKQLARLQAEGAEWAETKSFNSLSSNGILDNNKNPITKDALEKAFKKASDDSVIGYFDIGDEMVEIVKKNGIVSVRFDQSKYQTVFIEAGLVANRKVNFLEAAKELKKSWLKDPTKIPPSIAVAIKETNINLEDMEVNKLVKIIKKSDMVLHENPDMQSISLVPRKLHETVKHMGGFALAKNIRYHMGKEFFDRFISAAATGAVISTE